MPPKKTSIRIQEFIDRVDWDQDGIAKKEKRKAASDADSATGVCSSFCGHSLRQQQPRVPAEPQLPLHNT